MYEDAKVLKQQEAEAPDESRPAEADDGATPPDDEEEEPAPDPADESPEPELVTATDQEVGGDERQRIAIEEGEIARFEVETFKKRFAAWASGGRYILGGWFVAVILALRLAAVGDMAGIWESRDIMRAYRMRVTWGVAGLLLVLLAAGMFLSEDAVCDWFARRRKAVASWRSKRRETSTIQEKTNKEA